LNWAVLLPDATVTLAGAMICELLDDSCTLTPEPAAGMFRVAVHAAVPPPVSVCCVQETALNATFALTGGSKVSVREAPPAALTVAAVLAETADALTVNVTAVMPLPIITEEGSVRLVLDELREKEVLARVGLRRVRVQLLAPGVGMVAGVQVMLGPAGEVFSTMD
jgi:hypothetical protein